MRGFTDRALLLFSHLEDWMERSDVYKMSYTNAINNIRTYLEDMDMSCDCLITDRLACRYDLPNVRWVSAGTREDMFFMRNYCSVPDYEAVPLTEDIAGKVRKQFPIRKGMTPEERFDVVAKRVSMAEKALMDTYQFVIVIGKEFTVRSRPADGRAVLRINDKQFYTQLELSGEAVPINDFMQIPYANLPISEWGKYHG